MFGSRGRDGRTGGRALAGILLGARSSAIAAFAALALALAGPPEARAQFTDVTQTPLGVSTGGILGVSWADYDQDGDLDLYSADFNSNGGSRLFRRDGPNAFSDATTSATAGGRVASAAFADYDDDGDQDLYLNSGASNIDDNHLLRNDGGAGFWDITPPGMAGSFSGRSTTWVDFDGDGDLDLSVAGVTASQLFRNDGGDFTNIAFEFPLSDPGQTVAWGDFDRDGDADAYRMNGGPGTLARNDGDGAFTDVGTGVNVFGVAGEWGDYDNDADLDLFVGAEGFSNSLLRNDGDEVFVNVATGGLLGQGMTRTASWGDWDNDGDLDLVFAQKKALPAVLFRNDGNDSFVDVSQLFGADLSGAWAASWADHDGDGDLDLYVGHGENPGTNKLLRNDRPATNHWLHVKLVGTIASRGASGARVTCVAGGVTRVREMFEGAQTYCSQGSSIVEFGLGSAASVTSLTVHWPTGISQDVTVSGIDRVITATEPGFTPVDALAGGYTPDAPINFVLHTWGARVTAADLYSRPAGTGASYAQASLSIDTIDEVLEAGIPTSAASENGLEYYVRYRLNDGTSRAYPPSAPAVPAYLPANLGTRAQPAAAPSNEYVLFSVPFTPSAPSVAGVLEDDLGPYDNTKWRFGRYAPSSAVYLEAAAVGSVSPGRGYWLIEKNPVPIDASGVSTSTLGGVSVPIDPGWNQIGHPYLFDVPAVGVDFSNAPNVTPRFVGREGGTYVDQTTLQPWKGYWVFNSGIDTQRIVIPGEIHPAPVSRARSMGDRLNWGVEVRARAAGSADVGNVAGASSANDADQLTLPEPPPLPGTVAVWFERAESAGKATRWTTDIRDAGADAEMFDLVVETGESDATLSFAGLETLPPDRGAILMSDENLAAIDLGSTTSLPIEAGRRTRFQLIVGDPSALDRARGGLDRMPTSVQLAAPRPNPFGSRATIAFALPGAAVVDLAIYDVAGRRVRSLVRGAMPAGIHRVEWDASSDHGARGAPGVYFARLSAGPQERIEKLVLLK